MKAYDIIIIGGGLAGLSLAYQLVQPPGRGRQTAAPAILVVEPAAKQRDDRTFAFWSNRPTPFGEIVHRSWDRLRISTPEYERVMPLRDYRYQLIRGGDFFRFMHTTLSAHPQVTFCQARAEGIEDSAEAALVSVAGEKVAAKWLFDSRPAREMMQPAEVQRSHHLKLHFMGWEIETADPVFDPSVATLMDFRTAQNGSTRFFYVLPYSERRALVEYTVFSPTALTAGGYQRALHGYIKHTLGIDDYQVVRRESGCLPITGQRHARRQGKRVMSVGVRGGRLKPSTGYAFTRIQRDSVAIAASLAAHGHPFAVPEDALRFRLFDAILLQVMSQEGGRMAAIFGALFKHNPMERVLRFLDEDAGLREQLQIIPTVPPAPFLRALASRKVWGAMAPTKKPTGVPAYR